uniref:VQ domain-containing protein n=1 Tax=Rhizophora mucronata TaxID=61149 RepID=A0A2P2NXD9_RHIMU
MKVKTSASQFRAAVQELTGKDSDAAERIMDVNCASEVSDEGVNVSDDHNAHASMDPLMGSYQETPTSMDSIFEPFDAFLPPVEGGFMNMLQSNFFHESCELDLLNV